MKMVYIAGKYAGDVEKNVAVARDAAKDLWERGLATICPHMNTHGMEKDTSLNHRDFLNGDFEMIKRCDAIIMLPNWVDSPGAREEQAFARENGIPVYFYPDVPPSTLKKLFEERIKDGINIYQNEPRLLKTMCPDIFGPRKKTGEEILTEAFTDTGLDKEGVKYDNDKLRYDLIPGDALDKLAEVYLYGAKKYTDRNWEKGIQFGRVFAALQRHLWKWMQGEDVDQESKLTHLAHATWNCVALLHFMLNYKKYGKFDDRPGVVQNDSPEEIV